MTIEEWNATLDPFRQAYPGIPFPFPYTDRPAESAIRDVVDERIGGIVEDECCRAQIQVSAWSLRRRARHDERPGSFHVLGIKTTDVSTTTWKSTAQAIFLKSTDFGLNAANFQIEIFNPEKLIHNISSLFPNSPSLISDCEAIQKIVLSELQQRLPGKWTSIAFHSRRSHNVLDPSESKPTMIVFCKPGTRYDFERLLNDLMQIASDNIKSKIEIEIRPGEITLC